MADNPRTWMWFDAIEMLARAEHLHRLLYQPRQIPGQYTTWEPPVDVIETDYELLVITALPGVDPDKIEATIDHGVLALAGGRILPAALRNARIHRLELPQGRFHRRIPLPAGHYTIADLSMDKGCLVMSLRKA